MNFKIISDLIRRIANPERHQIAVQYPGKSVDPRWVNGEIVINSTIYGRGTNAALVLECATVFVFTSGDQDLDETVCRRILEANQEARLVLITTPENRRFNPELFLLYRNRLLTICRETHPKDIALTLLRVSEVVDFSADQIRQAFKDRLSQIGFNDLMSQDRQRIEFVTTAIQPQDRIVRDLPGGWTAFIFKTLLPIVRDMTDFRGIVLQGRLFNSDFTVYKESRVDTADSDVTRSSGLIHAFLPPPPN